jgi:F0F1-type ATP synthase membrane subunit a
MFLEILVGVVQATVFAMLTLVYLLIATTPHGEHESTHH